MRMESVFEHDATPTWSGFIYQGHVAVYVAVSKICDLLSHNNMDKNSIGLSYWIEVENWEDVAVFCEDENGKHYISIHQVKDRKEKNINDYKSPLIQLMLEKSCLRKQNLGNPEAYLHTSNKIKEDKNQIAQQLKTWKENIIDYYNKLEKLIGKTVDEQDKADFQREINEEIKKQPIGLNRKGYKELLENIKKSVKDNCGLEELKKQVEKLWKYLADELAVIGIDENVKLYQYDAQTFHCDVHKIFEKIVDQVKRFKDIDGSKENLIDKQYEYIADKLLSYMREHIFERHQRMMENKKYQKQLSFQAVIRILDESLSDYETNANIMALRRNYDEALAQYCRVICKHGCKEDKGYKCRLLDSEYSKINLNDEEFKRLCFSYNPNCDKEIKDRSCLNDLLDKAGLHGSVFEVLRKIPGEYFIQENNKTRIVLKDQKDNAFLTAIVDNNSEVVIDSIVRGINANTDLVSPIFEADELITVHLQTDDGAVWDNDYSEIDEKYISRESIKSSDDSRNSICRPKKPKFVKADRVIERLI